MSLRKQEINYFLIRGSVVLLISISLFFLFFASRNKGSMIMFMVLLVFALLVDFIYVLIKKRNFFLFFLTLLLYSVFAICYYSIINNVLFSSNKIPPVVIIEEGVQSN